MILINGRTSVFRHSTQTWRCIDYEANGFFTWNNTLVAFGNPRTGPPIVTIEEDIFKPLGKEQSKKIFLQESYTIFLKKDVSFFCPTLQEGICRL